MRGSYRFRVIAPTYKSHFYMLRGELAGLEKRPREKNVFTFPRLDSGAFGAGDSSRHRAARPTCMRRYRGHAISRHSNVDPTTRVHAGSLKPRAFKPDDDLSESVLLCPTDDLWV